MDRQELLERENEARLDLVDAFTAVAPGEREKVGVVPGWSVHDLVWHCAYWAGYASDVLERIKRGEPEPGDPESWDVHDAGVLAAGRGMGWDEIVLRLEQNGARARRALSKFDDPPEKAVQWFTDDTIEHYEEHAAEIRTFGA